MWIENTGEVPEGVGPDTEIEVEFRDGSYGVLDYWPADDIELWTFEGHELDIVRWRFV